MSSSLLEELQTLVRPDQLLRGEDVSSRYPHIWAVNESVAAQCILLPESTSEVAKILKTCSQHQTQVVVHGGLTNLVGSTFSQLDQVVIAMERMNTIQEVDTGSRTITCGAGTVLQHVQEAAQEHGLLFPLNFGAKGSAQLGGIIASNAGGLRVIKYGMTRNLVSGLEVVLADGTILSDMKKLIKNNTGYDLKQLFIGSEGTLGVITQVVLRAVEAPTVRESALVGLQQYEQVISLLKYLDKHSGGALSAFEIMWKHTYQALTSPPSLPKPPLSYDYPYYVLAEILGGEPHRGSMQQLIEQALEQNLIEDAVLATTAAELAWFWSIREEVGPMTGLCRHAQQFDISLAPPLLGPFVENILARLTQIDDVEKVFPFGHVGDGNIHFIVGKATDHPSLTQQINDLIYSELRRHEGSISAEHGIGIDKRNYLPYSRSHAEIEMMRKIKSALDPQGILNPGRIFTM